jgi:hypothetical protein
MITGRTTMNKGDECRATAVNRLWMQMAGPWPRIIPDFALFFNTQLEFPRWERSHEKPATDQALCRGRNDPDAKPLQRLHKYLFDMDIAVISDEMRGSWNASGRCWGTSCRIQGIEVN